MARGRIAEELDALIWPTLTYGHYPAFVEYAGSSSLSASTFEALVREIAAGILGSGCQAVRAQYRNQHAGAGRPRACASRQRPGQAFVDSRGPALSARSQAAGRAKPWQPCRRTRDLADAGDRAASGRHGARRSEPCPQTGDTGRVDALGSEFAELQPLRQLWRSDAGDRPRAKPCSPRCSTISANRSPPSSRKTLTSSGRSRSKACCGENHRRVSLDYCRRGHRRHAGKRRGFRADAQSEYMRGDRMPYDAFDRLPKTDLEVPGGTIHVAFAPGESRCRRKNCWAGSGCRPGPSRPIMDGSPSNRCGCCWCPSMAGAFAAARHGDIAARLFAFRSAAIPPRKFCSATG